MRIAAATAFFATFALPAIVLIIIEVTGLFYNPSAVKKGIFPQLVSVIGRQSSVKVYEILNRFVELAHNWIAAILGFLFLVFVVTNLFGVVRNSINELWNVKLQRKVNLKFYLKMRLKSTIIIAFACIVLVTQLIATALQIFLKDYIREVWNNYNPVIYAIASQLIFIVITACWFSVLFKYLANAHPDWQTALTGGIFTAILFTAGKIILSFLLTSSGLSAVFGKSGSFVLILLFVFYSSFIFYYGASFTHALLLERKKKLHLEKHAYLFTIKEVRSGQVK